jgi:hypothetical protein
VCVATLTFSPIVVCAISVSQEGPFSIVILVVAWKPFTAESNAGGALTNAGDVLDLRKGGRLRKLFNRCTQDPKRASGSRKRKGFSPLAILGLIIVGLPLAS